MCGIVPLFDCEISYLSEGEIKTEAVCAFIMRRLTVWELFFNIIDIGQPQVVYADQFKILSD